jgi:hypothetical protein
MAPAVGIVSLSKYNKNKDLTKYIGVTVYRMCTLKVYRCPDSFAVRKARRPQQDEHPWLK